jgi:hypothetical protein
MYILSYFILFQRSPKAALPYDSLCTLLYSFKDRPENPKVTYIVYDPLRP